MLWETHSIRTHKKRGTTRFRSKERTRVFNADYTFRPTEIQAKNSGSTSERTYTDSHQPSALWSTFPTILIPVNVFPIYINIIPRCYAFCQDSLRNTFVYCKVATYFLRICTWVRRTPIKISPQPRYPLGVILSSRIKAPPMALNIASVERITDANAGSAFFCPRI